MVYYGLQLYTVMDDARRDLSGTVKAVAAMGYEGIEFPGGMREMISGTGVKALLETTGLAMVGIVFVLRELEEELDAVVRYCHESHCDTAIIPWIDEPLRTKEGYASIARKFSLWGKQLKAQGISLLYHVHGYEFQDVGGTTGMELLMANMDPEFVNLEIDVYWVEHGGQDAIEFMKQYGGRSPFIHFKDMTNRQTFQDTEVGTGCIDMVAVATEGLKNNAAWFIVEQEAFSIPPMQSVEISLQNLRKIAADASISRY